MLNPDATLDYVEFHLFPSQNRYEASVQRSNGIENVASGPLEHLFFHSPEIRNLSSKGSNTNLKILPPESVNYAEWFTTATLTRFLHIIGLPDILGIGKEISQLEETKKFQLTLSDKAEIDITTSIESKNKLLLAVDSRLTSLKEELAAAFNQAIDSKYSPKDLSNLENFALHFGAKDLRDSLQKSVELTTEDKDSTYSSEEDQPSVERSRDLSRSSVSRRSASPMRRIQIGRSGSRRTAALNIKSLTYFPAKEKSTSTRDAAGNSSEEEEDSQRPPKNNELRMSVQDKISLFESKQKDPGVDIPKTKTLSNVTVSASKAVLRRWSSGIGGTEFSSPSSPKNGAPGGKTEPESNISDTEICAVTSENISFVPEADTVGSERDESCEKVAEVNEFMKMIEIKPVRHQNVTNDNSKNKNPKEQKGGFYDLYKKKRQEKFQGEASRKKVENESKIASTKVTGVNRTQKNSTQLINLRTTKPSVVKKSTSKTSPLPATRKSWPSTPSPKTAGGSPARTPTGPTSTNSTPTNRKPHFASTKVENSQPRLKTSKATPPDANKRFKAINEKKQPTVTENRKMTKTIVQTSKPDTTTPAKPSFYNKVTKKNSVVPLETKPFLRKGSGIKTKVMAQKPEENKMVTKIDITNQNQENECKTPENIASLDLEPQVVSLSPTKRDESESTSEEELEISSAAWVVIEENNQDEIIPCKESPIKLSSPANDTPPAGYSRPRVRHSLSQMFFEDSNETDIGEWGNAEHSSTLIYQKDAPRGLKRLLKFARKTKAESEFSDGEDDADESKAARSFFSLSAFRGNKTNEKLHR